MILLSTWFFTIFMLAFASPITDNSSSNSTPQLEGIVTVDNNTSTVKVENVTIAPRTQYPVFEEIRNFIYFNLEAILLVVSPITIIILFVAKKVNDRVKLTQEVTHKTIIDEKNEISNKIDGIEKALIAFKSVYEIRLDKVDERHTKLYESFKNLETDILGELKVIRVLLNKDNSVSKVS